jgi:hypothetical protein
MTYYESNKQKIKLKYLERKDDIDFKKKNNLSAKLWYYLNRKQILEKLRRERHKTKFEKRNILITFD